MFVTGSAGSFVAGGTGNLASEVAVHFVPECLGYSVNFVSDGHHPNHPLYFCTNGAISSPSTFLCLQCCGSIGGCQFLGLWLYLYGRVWSGCRRDWPVLPQLKQISWHLSCFGPWGVSTSWDTFKWWGLLSDVLSCEGFAFSEFTGAQGAVMGGCMIMLLVLGVAWGVATTHTLYLFVEMSFHLLSVAFVSVLTWWLVLGWAGLEWSDWGWNFGPNFPSNSR